jgi:cell division protein FtsB
MAMSVEQKRPWVKITSSLIRGGCVVLVAMVLLCCSKQKSLDAQIVKDKPGQAEVDGLKQQLAQLQAAVSQKDAELEKLQQRPTPAVMTAPVPAEAASPAQATALSDPTGVEPTAQQATRSVTEQEIVFQLNGCILSGSLMKCDLLITNKTGDRRLYISSGDRSRVIDDSGREYPATSFALGADVGAGSVSTTLPSDVPFRGQIQFDGVKPGTKKIQLLEMYCEIGGSSGSRSTVIKFGSIDL